MNEHKDKILNYTTDKIISNGFYKTSMDEISRDLNISKKTIYKYFPSKEELVTKVIMSIINKISRNVDLIITSDVNAVEKIVNLMKLITKNYVKLSNKLIFDVRYHMPSLWDKIDKLRTKKIQHNLSIIIEQGKKEGLFKDMYAPIILSMFTSSVREVASPEFLTQHPVAGGNAIKTIFEIILNGILTDKGKNFFHQSMIEVNL